MLDFTPILACYDGLGTAQLRSRVWPQRPDRRADAPSSPRRRQPPAMHRSIQQPASNTSHLFHSVNRDTTYLLLVAVKTV